MDERIHKIQQMLEGNPKDPFLHHALALEYIKKGDDKEARSHFETNLSNDPGYVATYYHLGKLLERQQQKETALEIYRQGMQVALQAGDRHSHNELQGAFEDLEEE